MRITEVQLENFKRFTHLNVTGIPSTAKLVLLIGSNGSGKSSLFDAFDVVSKRMKHYPAPLDYYGKNGKPFAVNISLADGKTFSITENSATQCSG